MVRIRQHVNPHKLEYSFPSIEPAPVPRDRPVEVEIGCADAEFLFRRAALDPSRDYIGLEIRRELVDPVNRRADASGLPVRSIFAHANIHVRQLFAPSSIDRVYVNFPDPWFKMRHRNRRVLDAALASDLAGILRRGGELFFQSDVFDLALDAMSVLEDEPRLANVFGPWSFTKQDNPYGVRTTREERVLDDGKPVWRMLYRRR